MTADEARERVRLNKLIYEQKEAEAQKREDAARQLKRTTYPAEWETSAFSVIEHATSLCRSETLPITIVGDLVFKRVHIRKWAEKNGYTIEFTQEHFAPENCDNKTINGYWYQNVTIRW